MHYKIFLNIFFIVSLFALQISFVSGLPDFFTNLNVVLVFMLFALVMIGLRSSLIILMGVGLLLDVYSFSFFGVYTITLVMVLFFTNFLLVNFFTNKSFYAFLVLILISTFFFELFQGFFLYFFSILKNVSVDLFVFEKLFWLGLLFKIFLNIFLTFILFYFTNFLSQKLKPAFLIRDKR